MYKVTSILADGSAYDITPLLTGIRWGGDINQAARKLEIDMVYGDDYYLPRYDLPVGSLLLLEGEKVEIMRGVVFQCDKNTGSGVKVTAYDHLIYLLKSKATYKFSNMSPEDIIARLCADFDIPVGNLAATGIIIEKLLLREQSIYDMCRIALTRAMQQTGSKYQMRMREGKLEVIEKGQQLLRWKISEGNNLIDASYSENITQMKNSILIIGDRDQVLAEVRNDNLIKQYGMLQEIRKEGNIKTGEAQLRAQNLLRELGQVSREASINCLGKDEVEAGTAIEVKESLTGLDATYYVANDSHTVENGKHVMNLKLNFTDKLESKKETEVGE